MRLKAFLSNGPVESNTLVEQSVTRSHLTPALMSCLVSKGVNIMAEVVRIAAFTTVEFEPGDWDGPHRDDDVLTYKSRTNTASLKVVRDPTVVFDLDYPKGKTI